MLKRPNYIALGLVVLLTLVMLNLPSLTTARMKLGIGSVFLPLFGLAGDKQQLRLQARQAEEIRRENERLRQLFGWQQQQRWKHKLANVVLREPANWWRTVQIDLGSRDGLSNNLAVLNL